MIRLPFQRRGPRGGLLRGELLLRESPPPRTAVVVAHGFKGFRDWGFLPFVCTALAARGHAVVSFNFSGSGVGPDGETLSELDAFAANTYTREVEELGALVEEVGAGGILPRRPRSVGILGYSRGGADALLVARERGAVVGALVTWAAVARLDRWEEETVEVWRREGVVQVLDARTGRHLPVGVGLLEDFEANRERLDLLAAAREVEVPWLIVHGREDLTVPAEEGRALARASGRARLRIIEGADHGFGAGHPFAGPSPQLLEALEATRRHFAAHLGEG